MTSYRLYARLLAYAKPYWPAFLLAALAMAVLAATETAFPVLMKPLLDKGFSVEPAFPLWWVPAAIILIFILRGVASFVSTYMMSWIASNVLRDLRQAMYDRLLVIPASTYDEKSSGHFISKIIAEVNGVTVAATNVLNTIVRDSLILLGLLAWLLWLNWLLTLVVFCLAPILIAITLFLSRRMRRVSRAAIQATGQLTRSVEQTVAGQRIVKLFQAHDFERQRFNELNRDYRAQGMRVVIAQALQAPLSQLVVAVGVAVVVTIALLQSRAGTASLGDFVSFITAMLLLLNPIRHLADINAQLQRALASAEAVFSMIDEKSEIDIGKLSVPQAASAIEFQDVWLTYASGRQPALRGINLVINPGEAIALVGPSGGGKSSLVNLLPRLYDPTQGIVRIGGADIREFALSSLRSQISVVSQEIILMNDSIGRNVAYGLANIDDQQLKNALDLADLSEFVASLPDGVDTIIGDRGAKLSGGQRQRLSIARAAYKDAPILILDEATSALDNLTESRVQQAFERLRQGRTTIVIAHRLSTIRDIPRIAVIDQGCLVAEGSFAELSETCELFNRITAEMSMDDTPLLTNLDSR